ncbi:MAG: phosphate transport system regulatory protein PhoU [Deltaproteobacteria bacterium]|nr:phosphate transport system regulatory protein PhoU [Deltaproteobacteria bacterium]
MPSHLERQIERLKNEVIRLGTRAEESVQKSLRAMENRDMALAEQVIAEDRLIDELEMDLEEECLKLLALYQPVATDLRYIVSVLKINSDLENIGDQAKKIGRRVLSLCNQPAHGQVFERTKLIERASWSVKHCLDAMFNLDAELARKVIDAEAQVDELSEELAAQIQETLSRAPKHIGSLLDELSICSHLEQIGDYTKKIAEDVVYMSEAKIIRHGGIHVPKHH